jgi:hypothetical protein
MNRDDYTYIFFIVLVAFLGIIGSFHPYMTKMITGYYNLPKYKIIELVDKRTNVSKDEKLDLMTILEINKDTVKKTK